MSLRYEQKSSTMSQVIKDGDYPVVVKVRKLSDKTFDSTTFAFLDQQEVLLQKRFKTMYAHIRTLKFDSHRNTSKMLLQETESKLGEECLIPVNYPGKLKFVHPAGRLARLTNVSLVLKEMPLYVILHEDAIAFPTDGTGKNIIVQAKTKLKIIRKYITNNTVYLECSDGKRCFAFSERDRVEFVEHEVKDSYQLCELVKMNLFPQTIRFEADEVVDNILKEGQMSKDVLAVMSGPLELVEFLNVEVIVGWIRDEGKQRFESVLIPNVLWEALHFNKMRPDKKHQSSSYIQRTYGPCLEAEVMGKVLFPLSMNNNLTTLLRASNTEIEFKDHMPQFEPETITLPTKKKEKQLRDRIVGRVRPNKRLLGAGKQLDMTTRMGSGSLADIPSFSHGKKYHKPKCRLSKSLSDITDFGSIAAVYNDDKSSRDRRYVDDSISYVRPLTGEVFSIKTKQLELNNELSESNAMQYIGDDFHHTEIKDAIRDTNLNADFLTEESITNCELHSGSSTGAHRQFTESPPIPIIHKKTGSINRDNAETIPVTGPGLESASEPAYVDDYVTMSYQVPKSDTSNIEKTGNHPRPAASPKAEGTQDNIDTAKDFFRYTVNDVSQCFSDCGLKRFGELCYENMLDGSFFRNFDMHYLKEDPFFLSPFELLKVQKIVVEGWRPTISH